MRNILSIGMVAGLLISLSGCGRDANAESPVVNPVIGSVLHQSQHIEYGTYSSKGSKVLVSQNDYEEELLKYSSDSSIALDFSQNKVLLIDMGIRNSGGYSIKINEVVTRNDHVVIYINLIKPSSNCVTTDVFENPYQFVKIETHHTDILVKESLITNNCE
jgi:hypothetical protein